MRRFHRSRRKSRRTNGKLTFQLELSLHFLDGSAFRRKLQRSVFDLLQTVFHL